jgi:hypothetical protein
VTGVLGSTRVEIFVDSGAEVSLVTVDVATRENFMYSPTDTELVSAQLPMTPPLGEFNSSMLIYVQESGASGGWFETKDIRFLVMESVPNGADVLLGLEAQRDNKLGNVWHDGQYGLQVQRTRPAQVNALVRRPPEEIARAELPVKDRAPQTEIEQYDFQYLEQLAKELNKSPAELEGMKERFCRVAYDPANHTFLKGIQVELRLKDDAKPQRTVYKHKRALHAQLEDMICDIDIARGTVEEADPYGAWLSKLSIAPKKPGKPVTEDPKSARLCHNLIRVNTQLEVTPYPMPTEQESMDHVRQGDLNTLADMAAAFNQFMVAYWCRHMMAFRTENGRTLQPVGAGYGCCIMPFVMQEFDDVEFAELGNAFHAYLDDFDLMSKGPGFREHHWDLILRFLNICERVNLKLRPSKCQIAVPRWAPKVYFGREVCHGASSISAERMEALFKLGPPQSKDALRSWIPTMNWWNLYILNMSNRMPNIAALAKKDVVFKWTAVHQAEYDDIMDWLQRRIQLVTAAPDEYLHLFVDACDTGVGAILFVRRPPVGSRSEGAFPVGWQPPAKGVLNPAPASTEKPKWHTLSSGARELAARGQWPPEKQPRVETDSPTAGGVTQPAAVHYCMNGVDYLYPVALRSTRFTPA